MAIFPKLIQNNLYQNLSCFFADSQANPKIHMEIQGIQNSQKNLENICGEEDSHFLFSKHYKSTVIKTNTV